MDGTNAFDSTNLVRGILIDLGEFIINQGLLLFKSKSLLNCNSELKDSHGLWKMSN